MKVVHWKIERTLLKKSKTPDTPATSDFRQQLANVIPDMAAAAFEQSLHLSILDGEGSAHPPQNYLSIPDTLAKFRTDFLPLSPLIDPRGRKVDVITSNFPKFLNLCQKDETRKKRAGFVVNEIKAGKFIEDEYNWEPERLRSIFWISDVILDPDAIYLKKQGFGRVPAEEVYLKVYKRQNVGSPVKVVFTHRVRRGENTEWMIISSYFTSRQTAKMYTEGEPLYLATR